MLGLLLGAAVLVLYMAVGMHDRLGLRMMSEGLSSDSRVVSWYLNDASRQGASQLIRFSADNRFVRAMASSNTESGKPSSSTKSALRKALTRIVAKIPKKDRFDAVLAVNQSGQVVGRIGFDQASSTSNFELGGYPLVADALHGHVRDDTLILGRMYRMVARPVGIQDGGLPAGAVIGAYRVDDKFAEKLSRDTQVAVAFFANGQRQGIGAPEGFDRTGLDQIVSDLSSLKDDEDFQKIGRTRVHSLPAGLSVVYAKLPGEAWQLGAGYAVVRQAAFVGGVAGVLDHADEKDKKSIQSWLIALVVLGATGTGLLLLGWEYSAPLASFRRHVKAAAAGETTQIPAESLRGPFRQLALDLNLALDRSSAEGEPPIVVGLQDALGEVGQGIGMSAFGVPQLVVAEESSVAQQPESPPDLPQPAPFTNDFGQAPAPPAPRRPQPALAGDSAQQAHASQGRGPQGNDVEEGWAEVYDEFVRIKRECGENVQGFTFERFSSTLRKNRDTLMLQHGVERVHFSAYIKKGRAALKAKPVRA